MRIQFKTDGGIAYFPGLSKPVTIDTDELSAEEAANLERLIENADFFNLPAIAPPLRGAADYRHYTISVTAREHAHTVRLNEPIEDPHVQALVDYLEGKAGELRTTL